MASIALYILLCVIWGSTWLVIKVGYGGLGPFNVAALRFLLAGAVLAVMLPLVNARWPRGRTEWQLVIWVGVVLFAADYGLIYWGEQFLDSGLTAILFATLPLMTVAFAHVYVPGDRITPRKLGGTLLAFLGVVALFGESLRLDLSKIGPMSAIIAGAFCAAAAGVASKRHGQRNAPGDAQRAGDAGRRHRPGGDCPRRWRRTYLPRDAMTWGAIVYLAIAGSVVSFLAYFSLLKTWSVTSLSFISVFTPAIALALGFVFLDEQPTLWTAIGAGLILSGVMLALLKASPRAR